MEWRENLTGKYFLFPAIYSEVREPGEEQPGIDSHRDDRQK